MKQTSFHSISTHRESPRFWVEGGRLANLGFEAGTTITIERSPTGFVIEPAILGDRTVSYKRAAGKLRPVIDLNNRTIMAKFEGIDQVKAIASFNRIEVTPTIRSAYIANSRLSRSTYRVLDVFGGGGTASDALRDNPRFKSVAVVEIDPTFADEYGRKHPDAEIFMGDFRHMDPNEFPQFDGIIAGIPCIEHSSQGRAKKSLAGKPELGEAGDLYIPVLHLIASRMPSFVVLENVPAFGPSLAGLTVVEHLRRMGYHVDASVVKPNQDYNEPTTRNRWVCFATLKEGFVLPNPKISFTGVLADYLDAPDAEKDQADAARIARSIAYLRKHNAAHAALGHNFAMTFINGSEKSCPTLMKSYYKINSSGAFVETPYGPRALRPAEFCRLNGHTFTSDHQTSVYQMSGQGVLTRMFRTFFDELGKFLP